MIPVYIITFNRLSSTQPMVEFLQRTGSHPIIVDNNSTYEPLLEWYESDPCEIVRLPENGGHLSAWWSQTIRPHAEHVERWGVPYYVVTDCDLDLSVCDDGWKERLVSGLDRYSVNMAGLSLRLFDLPLNETGESVRNWEDRFWRHKLDDGWWMSEIDTTFAMYRSDTMHLAAMKTIPAIRSDPPYECRHLPWYAGEPSEEDVYYARTVAPGESHWTGFIKSR